MWSELKSIGLWVMDGPRALLYPFDETGTKHGWLEPTARWSRSIPNRRYESWTTYRRCYGESSGKLPPAMIRRASWDIGKNKSVVKESETSRLTIASDYWTMRGEGEEFLNFVGSIEPVECPAEQSGEPYDADPTFRSYTMKWCTARCTYDLWWLTGSVNENLTECWYRCVRRLKGEISEPFDATAITERYELRPYSEFIDVPGHDIGSIIEQL